MLVQEWIKLTWKKKQTEPKRQGWTTKILLAAQVNYLTTKELKPLLPWTAHHLDLELLEPLHN